MQNPDLELSTEQVASPSRSTHQFSLQSILWMTIALCLLFSYAKWCGKDALLHAMLFASMGISIGLIVGTICKCWKDTLFWSLLIALMAYLAVEGGRSSSIGAFYGWGIVGAVCSSLSTVFTPKKMWLVALAIGAVGLFSMATCIRCFGEPLTGLVLFDVVCAGVVGAALHPFLLLLRWLEVKSGLSRSLLASWLTLSVLIGNFLVPILGGVQR